ncbi:MAG: hypothetical protein JWM14_3360 [Chitinophagaceae bacterium]|nr:hypothetical protein [Chitinophagaceae bacterium]
MKKNLLLLFYLLLLFSCTEEPDKKELVQTQALKIEQPKLSYSDSAAASDITIYFYKWYAEAIQTSNLKEIQPEFVKDSNGKASLEFSNYIDHLRKKGFTENLIKKEINRFKPCIENLKHINYDTLQEKYDLFDYEDIDCDFFNYYQWTKDMDRHDGADVENASIIGNAIQLKILFYIIENKKKRYWDHKYAEVLLIKEGGKWKIDNIEVIFNNKNTLN